jgi:hypothetical protein
LKRPGVLVVPEAYDPLWRLTDGQTTLSSQPEMSLLNGYRLPAGQFSGSLSFRGEATTLIGAIISFAAFVVLALLLFVPRRRKRLVEREPPATPRAAPRHRSEPAPSARRFRFNPGPAGWPEILLEGVAVAGAGAALLSVHGAGTHEVLTVVLLALAVVFALRLPWEIAGLGGLLLLAACPVLQLARTQRAIGHVAAAALLTLGVVVLRLIARRRRDDAPGAGGPPHETPGAGPVQGVDTAPGSLERAQLPVA